MAALTGQEIVSDIAKRLRSKFSEKEFAEIYKDKPVQSMKTPCIFIHSVETTFTPEFGNYAWFNCILDIRCHPGRMCTNVHTWARSLTPIIIECVERITIDKQEVRVTSANSRVEDDVLHVVVNYKFRVINKPGDAPNMETLTYGQKIKK